MSCLANSAKWQRKFEISAGVVIALLAVGAIAYLLFLIFWLGQRAALYAEEATFWAYGRIVHRVLYIAVLLAVAYVGLGLIEGKTICVLYLRRFHLNVHAIDPADRGGLGRRIRLYF
jgi:hypothetical protein